MPSLKPPLVAVLNPPLLPPEPLLLGNQPSGSTTSGESAPPAPSSVAAPRPPPSASALSTFPAPRKVSSSATGDATNPYNLDDSLGFSGAADSANADTAVSPNTDAAASS
jgi:hypothetical protein